LQRLGGRATSLGAADDDVILVALGETLADYFVICRFCEQGWQPRASARRVAQLCDSEMSVAKLNAESMKG
jgi:hypothetical protein